MRSNKLLVGVVFIVGCITGGAASQLVAPPALAGTSRATWEYRCTSVKYQDDDAMAEALNKHGEKGWELVTVEDGHACMKRRQQ